MSQLLKLRLDQHQGNQTAQNQAERIPPHDFGPTVPETTRLLTETLRTTVAEKHAIYERLLERERECASLRAELAELKKRTRRGKKT